MRNSLRTYLVGLLSVLMCVNPAAACHFCGGGGGSPWGGGYQPYAYGPAYYGPVAYSGGCAGCGGCNGCGYAVVVDECNSCQPCGGCGSSGGIVTESAPAESTGHPAPAAPTEATQQAPTPAATQPPAPAHVDRPVDNTPAPTLPPRRHLPRQTCRRCQTTKTRRRCRPRTTCSTRLQPPPRHLL